MITASEKGKSKAVPSHAGGGRPLTSRPEGPGTAFANFLIDYLPHTSLTNEQIAEKMNYARPNIVSMWKTGRTKVTLDAVWGLSELLDVDPAYMLALYFEQYAADVGGGASHFAEIAKMMGRVTTPEEWEIIKVAREARKYNSVPLKDSQRKEIKKLLAAPIGTEEGPLKEVEIKFGSSGDRRMFARRGHSRDMSISEIEDAKSRRADAHSGKTVKAGKRASRT